MNKGVRRTKAEFDILERIKLERNKRGWSDYELAENSGLTQSTISTWYNRGIEPGVASIEKICYGLGISLSQFFQKDGTIILTNEQQDFLDLFARLSPVQRVAVIELLRSFINE